MVGQLADFQSAEVTILVDDDGRLTGLHRKIDVVGRHFIKRLAAFFPGLGTGRYSGRFGGWYPGVFITFYRTNGSTESVHVNSDLKSWRQDHGDWPLAPDFRALLKELQGSPRTRRPALPRRRGRATWPKRRDK